MVEQPVRLEESLAPEVAATLIDLAQLAHHAGSATFDGVGAVAEELLGRILVLCGAQRGGILVGVDEHDAPEQPSSPSALRPKTFRALALQGIGEEEAHALLTTFPSDGAHAQPDPEMTCWITYRLPLGEFMLESEQSYQDVFSRQEINALPIDGASPTLVRQPVQVLLVLGWTTEKDSECAMVVERGHRVLPFVVDAVSSVIVSTLVVDRIHY